MTRTVPASLQAHLNLATTTTCRLLKIKLKDGTVFGLTTLDQDVEYSDGTGDGDSNGVVNYVATNGFDPSVISADLGYSVGNAEGYALISDAVPGVTVEMVELGAFDDATWTCYLVDFESLSSGHVILDAGDVGEVRQKDGMIWIPELLSYVMRLKQPIGSVWSRTCRAIFGTDAGSQTGCGVDITSLWSTGTVTSVGAETDRTFSGTAVFSSSGSPIPGRVQWLTGDNAGREYAIEEIDSSGISLVETTTFPIDVGDTYRVRPDCGKRYLEDCVGVWSNGVNFKGEPLIPVGDSSQVQTPGAQLPGGGGYHGPTFASGED